MTLEQLIEWVKTYPQTEADKRNATISFAYGNVAIHNPAITREMVEREYDKLTSAKRVAAMETELKVLRAENDRLNDFAHFAWNKSYILRHTKKAVSKSCFPDALKLYQAACIAAGKEEWGI